MKTGNKKIGLFGFGCVGQGLYHVLNKTHNVGAVISKICVKDKTKQRTLPLSHFTFDKNDILSDNEIDIVVELINDADEAFEIVAAALKKGKAVVSANKKMLAENFEVLLQLQKENNVPLLYEAAACGAIPIIRNLEEYYDNDLLDSIEGIFNGTTNYILSRTCDQNLTYGAALKEAQQMGFAESNPRLDVEGFDPKFKLLILIAHAFGIIAKPDEILNYGIKSLGEKDLQYAREKKYKVKLLARAFKEDDKITAYVLPQFIPEENAFYNVGNEFNSVQVQAAFAGSERFTGKGAGSHPTAAAVLSDISALRYNYAYGYKKLNAKKTLQLHADALLKIYLRYEHNSILQEITFEEIAEQYRSTGYKYIIGWVKLKELQKINLNEIENIFLAEVNDGERVLAYDELLEANAIAV